MAIISIVLGLLFSILKKSIWKDSLQEHIRALPGGGRNIVFISYRSYSRKLAKKVRSTLESEQYHVVMWRPDKLWPDPIAKIVNSIVDASAVVAVRPHEKSEWILAEHRLADLCNTTVVEVQSEDDLGILVSRVEEEVSVAKPYSVHPWERANIAHDIIGLTDSFGGYSFWGSDIHGDIIGILNMFRQASFPFYIIGVFLGLFAIVFRACS